MFCVTTGALGAKAASGGAIALFNYGGSSIKVLIPDDPATDGANMVGWDVMPWRGQAGNHFVIGGANFGTSTQISDVSIFFDGTPVAVILEVHDSFIKGVIPPATQLDTLITVQIIIDNVGSVAIKDSFMYIPDAGSRPVAVGVPEV